MVEAASNNLTLNLYDDKKWKKNTEEVRSLGITLNIPGTTVPMIKEIKKQNDYSVSDLIIIHRDMIARQLNYHLKYDLGILESKRHKLLKAIGAGRFNIQSEFRDNKKLLGHAARYFLFEFAATEVGCDLEGGINYGASLKTLDTALRRGKATFFNLNFRHEIYRLFFVNDKAFDSKKSMEEWETVWMPSIYLSRLLCTLRACAKTSKEETELKELAKELLWPNWMNCLFENTNELKKLGIQNIDTAPSISTKNIQQQINLLQKKIKKTLSLLPNQTQKIKYPITQEEKTPNTIIKEWFSILNNVLKQAHDKKNLQDMRDCDIVGNEMESEESPLVVLLELQRQLDEQQHKPCLKFKQEVQKSMKRTLSSAETKKFIEVVEDLRNRFNLEVEFIKNEEKKIGHLSMRKRGKINYITIVVSGEGAISETRAVPQFKFV